MHAKVKGSDASAPAVATVDELEAGLAEAQERLVMVQRENSAARTELPSLIANADAEGIRQARQRIKSSASMLTGLAESIEAQREAIAQARRRDLGSFNRNRLQVLERLAADMVSTSEALEDLTTSMGSSPGGRGAGRRRVRGRALPVPRCI